MINEVLYMEARLFRAFCKEKHMSGRSVNRLFNDYGIWDYIEKGYEALHTCGDEYIINDIEEILSKKGALL